MHTCHLCSSIPGVSLIKWRTLILSMQEWFLWPWSIEHAPVPCGPCCCRLLSCSGVHFIKCITRADFRCSVFLFMVVATTVFTVCSDLYKTLCCSVFFMLSAATVFTVCSDLYKTLYCSVFFMLSAATVFTVCSGMYKTVFFSCQGLLYSLYVQICTKHNGANKMQHTDLNKNVLLFSLLLSRRLLLYSLYVQICTKHSVVQSSFMPQAIAVFTVCSDLYQTQCCPVFFHAVGRCCIHCTFRSVLNTVQFNLLLCHRPLLYSLYVQICTNHSVVYTKHSVVQSSFYAVGRCCIHCMFRSVLNTVLFVQSYVKHNGANMDKMQH